MFFSRGSPGTKTLSLMIPALAGGFFTTSDTWEAQRHICIYMYIYVYIHTYVYIQIYKAMNI